MWLAARSCTSTGGRGLCGTARYPSTCLGISRIGVPADRGVHERAEGVPIDRRQRGAVVHELDDRTSCLGPQPPPRVRILEVRHLLPRSAEQRRGSGFNLGPAVSRYDESLSLIGVLDHLRDAYDLAKDLGHPELQAHLMSARRQLMQALHQSLNLHSQLAEAQERLAQRTKDAGMKGEDPIAVLTPLSDATLRRRPS